MQASIPGLSCVTAETDYLEVVLLKVTWVTGMQSARTHAYQMHLVAMSCSLTNASVKGIVRNKSPEFLVLVYR